MIDIKNQWVLQIDVTNVCNRNCSNCTRLIGHVQESFFMSLEDFEHAVKCLKRFPTDSPPNQHTEGKMLGVIGGEPLMHPEFKQIAEIIEREIPNREHRGLWTGFNWKQTRFSELIDRVFGYVNNNLHNTECHHSPILVSISDVVADPMKRKELIDNCWLQRMWAGTITPKGLFFCEVAGAFDYVLNGPGGLPVTKDCWERPLSDFQDQIDRWCPDCGIPLNLEGRLDSEEVDDISERNMQRLGDSPRVKAGHYKLYNCGQIPQVISNPWKYLK